MPDAPGTTVYQNGFAHSERRAHDQRFPRRPAYQRQACCLQMAKRGRFLADNAFGGNVVLGVTALAVKYLRGVPDFVSGNEARHARPHRFDNARYVMPGYGRQLHQVGIIAASNLEIQRVDRSRVNPDQNLSRLRHGLGHVAKFECLRAAK